MEVVHDKVSDYEGTIRDWIIEESIKQLDSAKTIEDFKVFYNIGSNAPGAGRVLWNNIVTPEYINFMSYEFIYRKVNELFDKKSPELVKLLQKGVSGSDRLNELANLVNDINKNPSNPFFHDKDVKEIIVKNYKLGEMRARSIAEDGSNVNDMIDVLDCFKHFIIKSEDELNRPNDYPSNIKLLWHYNSLKKCIKVLSTFIDGTTGLQSAHSTRYIDKGEFSLITLKVLLDGVQDIITYQSY